jgi:hypothetical protein
MHVYHGVAQLTRREIYGYIGEYVPLWTNITNYNLIYEDLFLIKTNKYMYKQRSPSSIPTVPELSTD